MVSLAAVEAVATKIWPQHNHAVVSMPDPRKGERLVLVTDNPDASRDTLNSQAKEFGLAAIAIPASVLIVDAIPVLGTGKVDFRGVQALVEKSNE